MTKPKVEQPERPQTEKWMCGAAQECIDRSLDLDALSKCSEIIARHVPYRAAEVEELVRINMGAIAALTNTDLDAEETITLLFKHLDEWRSALAALEEGGKR